MTKYATEQLKSTVMYISKTLLIPNTARAWTNKLKAEISKLSELPNRFMLVDEEPCIVKVYIKCLSAIL